MKTLAQSTEVAIAAAQNAMQQAKAKGTAVSLPARETPLTVADFGKLEQLIEQVCTVKPITKLVSVPLKYHDGYIYGWGSDLEYVGTQIIAHEDLDQRLIDAIQRPATAVNTIYHFTRLAAIKRNTRGDIGFQVVLEDLAYDLRGKSEWAMMKAAEYFRAQPSPFFPDFRDIIEKVEQFDKAAKNIVYNPLQIEGPKDGEK